jgi:hypothetical protein
MDRVDSSGGFTVLDGVALVIGAAIASIHVLRVLRDDLSPVGWAMLWLAFAWVAVTAAGPFLFLVRRFARRLPNYPRIGDQLWATLGVPWLVTALLKSAAPASETRPSTLMATTLSIGLAIACLVALVVVWSTWVMVSPKQAARIEAGPWTNRVGLILSIAWPIQCGLGMVVLS